MYLYLKDLLDRFNVGNALLYSLLLLLAVLVSLRIEEVIAWSYGAVFFPLWLWNVLVVAGSITGIIAWVWKKRLRQYPEHLYHFKALILSLLLQLPLFLTELLVAVNLDTRDHLWRAIFTPLYILPLLYILPCVWNCYRDRSVDLELLGLVSLLQVIFIGIRLDRVVLWKWAIVFIPMYILLLGYCCAVGVLSVSLFFRHLISTSTPPHELQTARLAHILRVMCSAAVGLCAIVFVALLASRLDGRISAPYPAIFIPLFLTFLLLLLSTVTRQPANPWWFGVHKTFSTLALDLCPVLREYANISIVPEDNSSLNSTRSDDYDVQVGSKVKHKDTSTIAIDLYPFEDIFTPN